MSIKTTELVKSDNTSKRPQKYKPQNVVQKYKVIWANKIYDTNEETIFSVQEISVKKAKKKMNYNIA